MSGFSVMIPVLNGAEHLGDALASVESQTLQSVSVVVSDNASTDATPEVLEAWKDRLDLRVIRQPKTLPMQDHFNALLEEVRTSRYMLLCHDDYLASADALEAADTVLDEYPEVPAVYCDLVYVNSVRHQLAVRRFRRGPTFSADVAGRETLRTARNMFGIPLGIRTDARGALRYDPCFHYAMDVDLSWSMGRGRLLAHIPRPLIANRYRAANTTWSLLGRAGQEFRALARKHEVPVGRIGRARLAAKIWVVNQQRRAFGLYCRALEGRVLKPLLADSLGGDASRFVVAGFGNTAFSYLMYSLGLFVGMPYWLASLAALILGLLLGFLVQGRFVFRSSLAGRLPVFVSVWAVLYLVNIGLIKALAEMGLNFYLAGGVALVPTVVASFLLSRAVVFRKPL